MNTPPIILWFRRDLRLSDHPALTQAARTGQPIIPLYIDETDAARPLGAASRWWLHHSLTALSGSLNDLSLTLAIFKGSASDVLTKLVQQTGATQVIGHRRYEADAVARDEKVAKALQARDISLTLVGGNLLTEPWSVQTKTGGFYKVFTPYWRRVRAELDPGQPLVIPNGMVGGGAVAGSLTIDQLGLLPTKPDWGSKMAPFWTPGEAGAEQALSAFVDGDGPAKYDEARDLPAKKGTSKLSPHLAFGEISPRQIWHRMSGLDADKYLAEIGWREFSYVLLHHFPNLAKDNFKTAFDAFQWESEPDQLKAWQRGRTGYPFVDAGMRQLWQTGWQHNRVRMVTASFLIKHLLVDWRLGEQWFFDTLVDADPASNAASWQWVAGSGADASPYFRIFNPISQGEKFDAKAAYIRRFVPELADLPNKYVHRPWEAPPDVLAKAGVVLGQTYPWPIVEHKEARERALARYKASRS